MAGTFLLHLSIDSLHSLCWIVHGSIQVRLSINLPRLSGNEGRTEFSREPQSVKNQHQERPEMNFRLDMHLCVSIQLCHLIHTCVGTALYNSALCLFNSSAAVQKKRQTSILENLSQLSCCKGRHPFAANNRLFCREAFGWKGADGKDQVCISDQVLQHYTAAAGLPRSVRQQLPADSRLVSPPSPYSYHLFHGHRLLCVQMHVNPLNMPSLTLSQPNWPHGKRYKQIFLTL